jgi:hypothetical protein
MYDNTCKTSTRRNAWDGHAPGLAPHTSRSWLHVPASDDANCDAVAALARMPVVRAYVPLRPAVLRHLCCGLTLVFRREFRDADRLIGHRRFLAESASHGFSETSHQNEFSRS